MIKLFSFTFSLDGSMYGGQIPAHSWDEAQALVPFALVDGELVAEQQTNLCAKCSGTISRDLTQPVPVQGLVWADVIGD